MPVRDIIVVGYIFSLAKIYRKKWNKVVCRANDCCGEMLRSWNVWLYDNFSVSEPLQETNSILYNSDLSEVFISSAQSPVASNNQPSIVDVMKFLERRPDD